MLKVAGVHLLWTVIFLYFAYIINEVHSLKTKNEGDLIKNFPVFDSTGDSTTSDVGKRFHIFFKLNFYM